MNRWDLSPLRISYPFSDHHMECVVKRSSFNLVLGLLLVGLLPAATGDEPDGFVEAFPLPDISLVNLNGEMVPLRSLAGKVTIVDFWATWCIPCLAEMPHFEALYKEYSNRGFRMVSLSTDEDPDFVTRFMEEKGLNVSFPMLMADSEVMNAFGGVTALPVTFVLDSSRTIVRKYLGFRYRETFESDIRMLLGLPQRNNDGETAGS